MWGHYQGASLYGSLCGHYLTCPCSPNQVRHAPYIMFSGTVFNSNEAEGLFDASAPHFHKDMQHLGTILTPTNHVLLHRSLPIFGLSHAPHLLPRVAPVPHMPDHLYLVVNWGALTLPPTPPHISAAISPFLNLHARLSALPS